MNNENTNLPENETQLPPEGQSPAEEPAPVNPTPAPAPAPQNTAGGPAYTDNRPAPGFVPPQNPGFGTYNPQFTPVSQPTVETEPPMRVRDWLLVLLLMAIPCVNLIVLCVWGFSDTPGKKSRSNFCKAQLIWMAISAALGVITYIITLVLIMIAGFSIADVFSEFDPNYIYSAVRALF